MTVPSEINRSGPYNGNGVTTVFDYGFRILNEAHIRVIKADADGNETTLTLTTDYTVSGVGNAGGGEITVLAAPATGETITILRNMPFTQETDLENQGAYYAETVEDALDAAAMRDQQLAEKLQRAVLVPASEDGSVGELAAQLAKDITTLAQIANEIEEVAGVDDEVVIVAGIADDVSLLAGVSSVLSSVASAARLDEAMFIGDDVSTNWFLPRAPGIAENVLVWIGGAIQNTDDYYVDGDTLTIEPPVANGVEIRTLIITLVTSNVVEGLIEQAVDAADRAEAAAAAFPTPAADTMIVFNGSLVSETKTFAEVRDILDVSSTDEMQDYVDDRVPSSLSNNSLLLGQGDGTYLNKTRDEIKSALNLFGIEDTKLMLFGFRPDLVSDNVLRIQPGMCSEGTTVPANIMMTSGVTELDLTTNTVIYRNDLVPPRWQGCLDTGSPVAGQEYFVYMIKNPTTGVVAAVASKQISPSLVTKPAGFTLIRKLPFGFIYGLGFNGGIPTYHLSNWPHPTFNYTDTGTETKWRALAGGSSTSFAQFSLNPWVPDNARWVHMCFVLTGNVACEARVRVAGTGGDGKLVGAIDGGANGKDVVHASMRITSGGLGFYRVTNAAGVLNAYVTGYDQTEVS